MTNITAQMHHTKDTIYKLAQTQYDVFCFGRQVLQLLLGIAIIGVGIARFSASGNGVIILLAGCVMVTGLRVPPRYRANRVIDSINGNYPASRYEFKEGYFLLDAGDEQQKIPYEKLLRLVSDKDYCYLYISKSSAYMIDKASLSTNAEAFCAFIESQSGLEWTRPNSLLTYNIHNISQNRKATKKHSNGKHIQ